MRPRSRLWLLGVLALALVVSLALVHAGEHGRSRRAPNARARSDRRTTTPMPIGAPRSEVEARLAADASTPDGSVIARTTADEIRERLCPFAIARACAARARCGCAQEEAECQTELVPACERWVASRYEHTAWPVDETAFATCLRAIERAAADCSGVVDFECGDLAPGPVRAGEPCADSGECRDGHCAEGVCRRFAALGASCASDFCAPGLACFDDVCTTSHGCPRECGSGRMCRDARCVRIARLHERCGNDRACESGACVGGRCELPDACDDWTDCGVGRDCDGEITHECRAHGATRTCGARLCPADQICSLAACVAPPREGEPCPENACAPGSYCLEVEGNAPHCVAHARVAARGESCDGARTGCEPGLGCAIDDEAGQGTCLPLTIEGRECERHACPYGSFCAPTLEDGHCRPRICARVLLFEY
jgi:hypothetical protein